MTGKETMPHNNALGETDGSDANIEKRLSEMNMQLIRMMTEFVKQEEKTAERYRECIDRLQEQNKKLTDMLEKMMRDEEENEK